MSKINTFHTFNVWRKIDGKQALVTNCLKQGERVMLYKLEMRGYEPVWCAMDTFKATFSMKPVTAAKDRVAQTYRVTA